MIRMCGLAVALVVLAAGPASAQESCLDPDALLHLDSEWERALLESDAELLRTLLAEDFIWVHNHASAVDTKAGLVERASDPAIGTAGSARSRVQSNVEYLVLGSTGVVTGFTVVDRGSRSNRYNFMRTYAEVSGRCLLLANHTMEIPEDER
jgi:hypothetical protein